MRPTRRITRNALGDWAVAANNQAASNNQAEANFALYIDKRKQTDGINVVDEPKGTQDDERLRIEIENERTLFCLLMLILAVKILFILVTVSFWIVFFTFIKTLFFWTQATAAFGRTLAFITNYPDLPFWVITEAIFPDAEVARSYSLMIHLAETPVNGAAVVFTREYPILLTNPVIWFFVLLILLLIHPVVRFFHTHLLNAKKLIEVTLFHQTLESRPARSD
jgi:hypothetical protein